MRHRYTLILCLTMAVTGAVRAIPLYASDDAAAPPSGERAVINKNPAFPGLYYTEWIEKAKRDERGRLYGVQAASPIVLEDYSALSTVSPELDSAPLPPSESAQGPATAADGSAESPPKAVVSLLQHDDIVAFYGSPMTDKMGILGAYSIPDLAQLLSECGALYDAANGDRGIRLAFYLVYGTVWPEGEIGLLKDELVKRYIDFALANDMLVFLDHQIGKYTVEEAVDKLLPYLDYPNVHLALDPEWRTDKPMLEIGSVSAEELNEAQSRIEAHLIANSLPGERLLIIHQFNWRMIRERDQVKADFDLVRLVHCADGFGPPQMKREAYRYNAEADNLPVKGFKLFLNRGLPGAGFDEPLMLPEEVMKLDPPPTVIMYQ